MTSSRAGFVLGRWLWYLPDRLRLISDQVLEWATFAINIGVGYYDSVKKLHIPEEAMVYFRKVGALGGKARAANHSEKQLSAWGKLGGRPKGSGKKQSKKGGL